MAAADPAPDRAVLTAAGFHGADRDRVLRHPDHRPLPEADLRVQPRRAAPDLAGVDLRLGRAGHRPLPAVSPRAGAGLPGSRRHWEVEVDKGAVTIGGEFADDAERTVVAALTRTAAGVTRVELLHTTGLSLGWDN